MVHSKITRILVLIAFLDLGWNIFPKRDLKSWCNVLFTTTTWLLMLICIVWRKLCLYIEINSRCFLTECNSYSCLHQDFWFVMSSLVIICRETCFWACSTVWLYSSIGNCLFKRYASLHISRYITQVKNKQQKKKHMFGHFLNRAK